MSRLLLFAVALVAGSTWGFLDGAKSLHTKAAITQLAFRTAEFAEVNGKPAIILRRPSGSVGLQYDVDRRAIFPRTSAPVVSAEHTAPSILSAYSFIDSLPNNFSTIVGSLAIGYTAKDLAVISASTQVRAESSVLKRLGVLFVGSITGYSLGKLICGLWYFPDVDSVEWRAQVFGQIDDSKAHDAIVLAAYWNMHESIRHTHGITAAEEAINRFGEKITSNATASAASGSDVSNLLAELHPYAAELARGRQSVLDQRAALAILASLPILLASLVLTFRIARGIQRSLAERREAALPPLSDGEA